MTEKRRISTRFRGEPPFKKRATTPPPPPPPALAAVEPVVHSGLPTRLQDGQKLPTLSRQQDPDLPSSEYHSIAESGVLAASIEQSRRNWTVEGIFERYWSKPSKKRKDDVPNPAKESMTRLGSCSMVIEPHAFEVTLYTVRESRPTYHPPISQTVPSANLPYGSSPAAPPIPVQRGPFYGHQPPAQSQPTLPTFKDGFSHFDPQVAPPPIYHPFGHPTPSVHNPGSSNAVSSSLLQQNGSQKSISKPSPDPVIQMLATRAASDHALKALMKVVASGKATQTELREFQNHIDDLNVEINAGRGPPSSRDQSLPKQPPSGGTSTNVAATHNLGQASSLPIASQSSPFPPSAPTTHIESPTYSQYALQPPKAKPINPYKPDMGAIVFDFGGTGDRFSIPRFSILEYLSGGTQVIVSFLIIRTGGEASSGNYKENMSYYEPVTMQLSTQQPRTLDLLARVVAPAEEVRQYMNDVFDKMKPAETAYLAIRLPRTKDGDIMDLDRPSVDVGKPVIKPFYSPPNSIVPMAA